MDIDAARLTGVKVATVYAATFAIGAGMAGAAGSLLSMIVPFDPTLGGTYTQRAFAICVLGGLGNVANVVIGAAILRVRGRLRRRAPAVPVARGDVRDPRAPSHPAPAGHRREAACEESRAGRGLRSSLLGAPRRPPEARLELQAPDVHALPPPRAHGAGLELHRRATRATRRSATWRTSGSAPTRRASSCSEGGTSRSSRRSRRARSSRRSSRSSSACPSCA